ncbi:hypothetical protein TNCV_63041 [Trichonephila clavipes]|nr:hypothetical protein TNCV_63041 [Trichonephila clavipes]
MSRFGGLSEHLQCLRPEASLVLIYRPNVAGMKAESTLRSPLREPLACGVETLYITTRSFSCHGSLVVMAGMLQVQAKYPSCRGTMHIKSVEFKRPPIGVVVRRGEFQLRCRP